MNGGMDGMRALIAILALALATPAAAVGPVTQGAPGNGAPPGAGAPPPPAPPAGARLLAEELAFFTPPEGSLALVLVRYRSQVGARLEVEGSDAVFSLPEDRRFPVIADPKTRKGVLEVQARVTRGAQGETVYAVEEIRTTLGGEALFTDLAARLPATPPARRRVVVGWALAYAGTDPGKLRDMAIARWVEYGGEELNRDRTSAIDWLAAAQPYLSMEPKWIEFANRVGERYGSDREIAAKLGELGLVPTSRGWKLRSALLAELGMVERDGETITLEQAHLLTEISRWRERAQPADMLRGRTAAHYAREAEAGKVSEGMKREEVVLAWGYPDRVTWRREGGLLYEGWFWPTREVYFVEGAVCFSQD
jgi:hypothetical protein